MAKANIHNSNVNKVNGQPQNQIMFVFTPFRLTFFIAYNTGCIKFFSILLYGKILDIYLILMVAIALLAYLRQFFFQKEIYVPGGCPFLLYLRWFARNNVKLKSYKILFNWSKVCNKPSKFPKKLCAIRPTRAL